MIYEDLAKICKDTYITSVYKDRNHVQLYYKGYLLTDWITLRQAYIVVTACLESDEINALLNDF